MKQSKVIFQNGNPFLSVDDKIMSPCAYITYFEENNDYQAFSDNGFRIYSVSVALANQPINTASGFCPHAGGVFDKKGVADFSHVDAAIARIIESCPDAYIFPRIYVCMPEWWILENPTETTPVPHGKRREALYSQKFREDAAKMLCELIDHFKEFFASEHIIGYQISGGNTQEWFHLDLNGSFCENALPYFNEYLAQNGFSAANKLPDIEKRKECEIITDPLISAYIRFANDSVAQTVEFLCKTAKEKTEYKQIIGVFYGYTMEIAHYPLWGSHSLSKLLDSPYIDFFSSPNSYADGRSLGIDWPDMMPVDSVKLHGKMCFIECDIRTFLTKLPNESRAGCDPYNVYVGDVFKGPPTEQLSVWAVRKSLARQLTHKHGLWWFDMFGHWYSTPSLMQEMKRALSLYNRKDFNDCEFSNSVAVFLDETAYAKVGEKHPAFRSIRTMKSVIGSAPAPYSVFLASDFDEIDWQNSTYKAVLFLIPGESEFVSRAQEKLSDAGISTLAISAQQPLFSCDTLVEFYKKSGVFLYCDSKDVVYSGNGFFALHSASDGQKHIRFPKPLKCTDVENGDVYIGDQITFECQKFETKLFMTQLYNE